MRCLAPLAHAIFKSIAAAATGSKTYILRSVLHPTIIEHAALSDEAILTEEAVDLPENDDEAKSYGSIIAWSSADQLAALGILHVVLALILVSGRVMNDGEQPFLLHGVDRSNVMHLADLRSFLRRMRLQGNSLIPSTDHSTHKSLTLDTYLQTLMRQGYLDRRPVGDSRAKKSGAGKRIRIQAAVEDEGITWEWRWGTRAHSEVGEQGLGQFVAEFMVESERRGMDDEEAEGEADGRAARKRREKQEADARKRLELVLRGIKRAAGGDLADLK